jgi:hypothetical protein
MKKILFIGRWCLLLWCTTVVAQPKINLTGTMNSGKVQVALIDGDVCYIGDEISGCTIKEINKQGITVLQAGKSTRILVGNGKSENTNSSRTHHTTGALKSSKSYLPIISTTFIIVGSIVHLVGGFWFIIVSFRTSIWWGLCCLFIPLGELMFLIVYWKDTSKPFGVSLLGIAILVGAIFIAPEVFQDYHR